MKLANNKSESEIGAQISRETQKNTEKLNQKLHTKEIENERLIFELNEVRNTLKVEVSRRKEIEEKLSDGAKKCREYESTLAEMSLDK